MLGNFCFSIERYRDLILTANSIPKVVILLATYNGEAFVAEQISSILSQTGVDVHIYVRDDGSSDGTLALVSTLQTASPDHITVVRDELGATGSAAANFFALLENTHFKTFDYVAFADQDDIWLPAKLRRAVECISGQGGGGYSSDLLAWDTEKNAYWTMQKRGSPKKFDYLFQGASAGCTYVLDVPSALLVQRRIAPLARQYCAGVSHDWAIYAICRSAGVPWFCDTKALIHYRQHSENVYGARPGLAGILARMGMVRNGWYLSHILWLENLIENCAEERRLLARLKHMGIGDRLYLAARAGEFRRQSRDVWKLRLAFTLGLLRQKST